MVLLATGAILNGIPFETPVIPAKAGIQPGQRAFPNVCGVDSRFRGNDCDLQCPCLTNEAGTPGSLLWTLAYSEIILAALQSLH
jgi:hypothetical protein